MRETEKLVKDLNNPREPAPKKPAHDLDYTRELERSVQKKLGRPVKIVQKGENSTINIGFTDNQDLENVLKILCGDDFVNSL